MKNRWRAIFVVTIAGFLFIVTGAPSDAARRVAKGSPYDGTWSVAIYRLRGDCGSLRAALRIAGGRVIRQKGALVDLGFGSRIVSAADLSERCHAQSKHHRGGMSSLARGVDRMVDFRQGSFRIPEQP